MTRRSRGSGTQAKARLRKAEMAKRRNAAAEQLARERDEALKQLSAASEVLKIISSSPGELEPVFQTMLGNAIRICDAKFGILFRFDGNAFDLAAQVGTPPEYAEFLKRRGPFQSAPGPTPR